MLLKKINFWPALPISFALIAFAASRAIPSAEAAEQAASNETDIACACCVYVSPDSVDQ